MPCLIKYHIANCEIAHSLPSCRCWDRCLYIQSFASPRPGFYNSRYILSQRACNDRRHLLELTTRLREVEGVVSTETFPYLSLAKQVYAWGTHLVEEEDA